MKNFVQITFIILMFILSSCTSIYVHAPERFPAEVNSKLFEAVFSIPRGNVKLENDMKDFVLDELHRQEIPVSEINFKISLVENKNLPKDTAYKIDMIIDPKTSEMIFRVQHAAGAFNDPIASYSMLDYLSHIVLPIQLQSPFSTFELYHNAKAGDPTALEAFFKFRAMPNYAFSGEALKYLESENYKKSKSDLEKLKGTLTPELKAFKAKRLSDKTKRKAELNLLDKAPESQQFRTLVSKGDRQGAAEVLKKYLPWEEMAPFEKQFWETYLDVITNPVPLEERVLIYRGVDGDFIHKAYAGGKNLTEKEAIEQNKAFFMSSLMVKNQGSWNRRLRSLEAMNEKFIATVADSNEYSSKARITTMFLKHSGNPQGSPFLSFTPKFSVAEDFGFNHVSGYLIDPRLLNFNYTSLFEEELEYLVPLTTFPDELVGIVGQPVDPDAPYIGRDKILNEKLEKLIASNYGERKDEVLAKIKRNSFDFFKNEYAEIVDPGTKSFGKSNKLFYKNFITNKGTAPVLTPNGDLSCKDLIELFWVADL